MSWSDLFFPGNPGRRDEVVSLFTQLLVHMENNFTTTNDLIAIVHEHLPGRKFKNITVDHNLSIKDNCDRFITRIDEIQAYLKEKKKQMKTNIDPVIYRQIMDTKVNFAKKLELARKITGASLITIGTAAGLGVCASIQKGRMLVSLADKFSKLKVIGAASVLVGIAFMAMDAIASVIIGAVQRDKLEESIRELETALDIFVPASREYTKQITKMSVTIEILAELGLA